MPDAMPQAFRSSRRLRLGAAVSRPGPGRRSRAMKFRPRPPEEPEVNLIPFIDVLLVILIFLMLTTTYNRFTELQLTLPVANADAAHDRPKDEPFPSSR